MKYLKNMTVSEKTDNSSAIRIPPYAHESLGDSGCIFIYMCQMQENPHKQIVNVSMYDNFAGNF